MDVVLLKDVEKVGAEGCVIHVKPGFARNYLLPRGLAVPATPQQLKAVEERQRQRQQRTARIREEAEALKRTLESRSLTLKLTLGDGDKPFGSVTTHDILEALQRDGVTVENHPIHLDQPLKTLGIYEVPIRVHPDVTATLKVWIVKA